jgi:hypothetical protein
MYHSQPALDKEALDIIPESGAECRPLILLDPAHPNRATRLGSPLQFIIQ